MYNTLLNIITGGDYQLSDIINKINTLWVTGSLNDDQRTELLAKEREYLNPEQERPEIMDMLELLAGRMTALESRVKTLEGDSGEDTAYPEWVPWDGMSSNYQTGAIVSHNGRLWQSVHNGQNVWEPGTPETENLWAEYIEELV